MKPDRRSTRRSSPRATVPVLPVRETVVFPESSVSFVLKKGPGLSLALEAAEGDRELLILTTESSRAQITPDELARTGTVCRILHCNRLPDGNCRILLEGLRRVRVNAFIGSGPPYRAQVSPIGDRHKNPAAGDRRARARGGFLRAGTKREGSRGDEGGGREGAAREGSDRHGAAGDGPAHQADAEPGTGEKHSNTQHESGAYDRSGTTPGKRGGNRRRRWPKWLRLPFGNRPEHQEGSGRAGPDDRAPGAAPSSEAGLTEGAPREGESHEVGSDAATPAEAESPAPADEIDGENKCHAADRAHTEDAGPDDDRERPGGTGGAAGTGDGAVPDGAGSTRGAGESGAGDSRPPTDDGGADGEGRRDGAARRTGESRPGAAGRPDDLQQLMRTIADGFRRYTQASQSLGPTARKIPPDVDQAVRSTDDPDRLVDLVAGHLPLPLENKLELLRIENPGERLDRLAVEIESELHGVELKRSISSRVRKRLEKGQREYYLNQQLREIQRELGTKDEDPTGAEELKQRLAAKDLPDAVRTKAEREVARLGRLQPVSPEAGILRSYCEWIAELPWLEYSADRLDLGEAERILDEDHYDMETPKERVLDYIAVHTLRPDQKGPILCFVGPPGTGKTSLGASLARALDRRFVRLSLGGVRDEAEIRGHRKTYVGALPGKIIQSIRKAERANPVLLLDEVDKLSSDVRGDPASALLEVLDPEQNNSFLDHYLEVPFDLSRVMFVTTANSLHNIPHPLRDRMEIIEVPGYSELEKLRIAQRHLIPRQISQHGLDDARITIRRDAIRELITSYTMESGVRELNRNLATVSRKLARRAVSEGYRAPLPHSENGPEESGETGPSAEAGAAESTDRVAADERSQGGESTDTVAAADSPDSRADESVGADPSSDSGATGTATAGSNEGHPEEPADADEVNEARERSAVPANGATGYEPLGTATEAPADEMGEAPADEVTTDATVGVSAEQAPGKPGHAELSSSARPISEFRAVVTRRTVRKLLGRPRYVRDLLYAESRPGVAQGLAWTETGGTVMPVEVSVFEGSGELILTGSLGDVMKESARIAVSFIKHHAHQFHLRTDVFSHSDLHIHVPHGAIPKDGPSAGITVTAAILSALTGISPVEHTAMTGEITLTGRLLRVGGIKEKVLAAIRNKLHTVVLPEGNRPDCEELPSEIRHDVRFLFADSTLAALQELFPAGLDEARST